MATLADIDRLTVLVNKLTPLSRVNPGETLLAEAWNTVVSTLIELTRAVLLQDNRQTVPPHDHDEQVSITWLDARLKSLIEKGPLGDPLSVQKVQSMERQMQRLMKAYEESIKNIEEIRKRLSEIATKDIVREADITQYSRKIDSIKDSRDDVMSLRLSMDTIKTSINTVLEASEKFKSSGSIVDMKDIDGRLKSLEELKQRLQMPSGGLFDASNLEMRLAELQNKLVTEEELTVALDSLKLTFDSDVMFKGIRDELFGTLSSKINSDKEILAAGVKTEILNSIPSIATLVTQQDLNNMANNLVRKNELTTAMESVKSDINIESRLTASAAAINELIDDKIAAVNSTISGLQNNMESLITAKAADAVTAKMTDINAAITSNVSSALNAKMTDINAAIASNVSSALNAKMTDINAAITANVNSALNAKMTDINAAIASNVSSALNAKMTDINAAIEAKVDSALTGKMSEINSTITINVNTALTAKMMEINTNITTKAGEIAAAEAKKVSDSLMIQINTLSQSITKNVTAALDKLKPELTTEITNSVTNYFKNETRTATYSADFGKIDGIGETYNIRLANAGVKSFTELAALPAAQVAKIIGASETVVKKSKILEQAAVLAERYEKV